jgi:dynein heavy chain
MDESNFTRHEQQGRGWGVAGQGARLYRPKGKSPTYNVMATIGSGGLLHYVVHRPEREERALAARYAEAAAGLSEEAGMERLGEAAASIAGLSPGRVTAGLFRVDCAACKSQLAAEAARLGRVLQDRLASEARAQSLEVARSFENVLTRVKAEPANAAELAALQTLARSVEEVLVPRLQTEVAAVHEKLAVLEQHLYPLSREDSNLAWEIRLYPRRVHEALQDTKMRIAVDTSRFKEQLAGEKEQFARFLAKAAAETENIASLGWGTLQEMEAHATRCEDLHERLLQAERQVESFGERNRLFAVEEESEAEEKLAALRASLQPYYDLWSSVSDFNASHSLWMTGGFTQLDPAAVSERTSAWFALFYRLERQLAEAAPDAAKVAEDLRIQVDAFRKHVPLIEHLRGKGLRARHWEQLGLSEPDGTTTLSTLLSQKLDLEAIEEVCCGAEKEFGLEKALDRMRDEWREVALVIEEYKETKTYTLRGSDDVLQLLDDHVMKTQAMQGSPYVKPFAARTKAWEARLQHVQQVMEEWLNCQKSWLYLEPIFSSDDIMRQLPTESRRFGVVDAYWRKTMAAARRSPNALDFCSEHDNLLKGLLDSLQHAGVYESDSQIDDLRIVRGPVIRGGAVIVQIQPMHESATWRGALGDDA